MTGYGKKSYIHKILSGVILGSMFFMMGCSSVQETTLPNTETDIQEETVWNGVWTEEDKETLRYVFEQDFDGYAGVCLPEAAFSDEQRMELAYRHFNYVTMENEMKPETFLGHSPKIGEDGYPVLDFSKADSMLEKLAQYNESCDMEEKQIRVRGHVLVWHSQTPEWFFHENYDPSAPYVTSSVMLERMENYIAQVMEHFYGEDSKYGDMICAWDVVNEAVNDTDGMLRADSSWFRVFKNERFVVKAFVYANRYAPDEVKLFYNDYNDTNPTKAGGICRLIDKIKKDPDARIDGMGMQGHHDMNFSVYDFEEAVRKYASVVDEIQITELDLKSSEGYRGENQDEEYLKQAYVYKALYDSVKKLVKEEHLPITGITFWGTDDGNSWLQSANSVGGSADGKRQQCPLLFDASYGEKPAFDAFVRPQSLPVRIQTATAVFGTDFSSAKAFDMQVEKTKVQVQPVWNEEGLSVRLLVVDNSESDADQITIYVDPQDSRKAGAQILTATVKRSEVKSKPTRYEAVIQIPIEQLQASRTLGFDVCVTDNGVTGAWNDAELMQEKTSENYGKLILE